MGELPEIGMLWMRGGLSYLEQLCVQSFLDAGHHVVLFSYDHIDRVPDGVERRDAESILSEDGYLVNEMTGSPALHSDLFRYRLLEKHPEMIWADTDAYCMKPFETKTGHFFGYESEKGLNGGVLGLPKGSQTLAALLEFTRDEYAIPKWYKKDYIKELKEARDLGEPVHVGKQPWGAWGPHALTYFLKKSGEVEHALPCEALYPYSFHDRRKMVKPRYDPSSWLTENTFSVHLYGRRMRKFLCEAYPGIPPYQGLMGRLLIKHKINPLEAPLRDFPNPNPDGADAKAILAAIKAKPSQRGFVADQNILTPQLPQTSEGSSAPSPVTYHAKDPVPAKLDKVVAITTMRDEGPYILDWISYHLAIGFTHFLVFTNDCRDGTDEILDALSDSGVVTRVANPAKIQDGERPQRVALEMAESHELVRGSDAYMVFDVDEYLNIHTAEGTLRSLFERTGNPQMISVTWRFFGNSGVRDFEDRPMPLQFTRCAPEKVRFPHHNWGFKTLVRQPSIYKRLGIHRPLRPVQEGMPFWINGSGKQMQDKYYNKGWRSSLDSWGYELATLSHYSVRSLDGYLQKRDRGRTNHINRDQGIEYWNVHNRNDQFDTRTADRFQKALPIRQKFRDDPRIDALHRYSVSWHQSRIAELKKIPEYKGLYDVLSGYLLSHKVPLELVEDLEQNKITSVSLAKEIVEQPIVKPQVPKPNKVISPEPSKSEYPVLIGDEALAMYQSLQERNLKKFPRFTDGAPRISREKITLVTTMRDEAPYILEWIAYHLSIGVTNFLVYTNDCLDETNAVLDRLQEQGVVQRFDNPFARDKGQKPQRGALNDAITQPLIQQSDWYMCMDVDEFIQVNVGDGTLSTLIDEMGQPNLISMTWRFFGNAGIARYEDRWIIEQFLHCAPYFIPKPRMGWGVKTMVHKSAPFSKIGVHRPLLLDPERLGDIRWVNGSGNRMPETFPESNGWRSTKRTFGYDYVTLNHYALRSAEGYLVKRARGRVNHVDEDMGEYYWRRRNYISEIDERILTHLPRAKNVLNGLLKDNKLADLHAEAVKSHNMRINKLKEAEDFQKLFAVISKIPQEDSIYMKERQEEEFGGEDDAD